jgi:hypothetical protein
VPPRGCLPEPPPGRRSWSKGLVALAEPKTTNKKKRPGLFNTEPGSLSAVGGLPRRHHDPNWNNPKCARLPKRPGPPRGRPLLLLASRPLVPRAPLHHAHAYAFQAQQRLRRRGGDWDRGAIWWAGQRVGRLHWSSRKLQATSSFKPRSWRPELQHTLCSGPSPQTKKKYPSQNHPLERNAPNAFSLPQAAMHSDGVQALNMP